MKKTYRWGIIGPGKIAKKFAEAIPIAGDAVLEAVASKDSKRGTAFAKQFNAARSFDSYEALGKDSGIDAVYIAVPHAFHMDAALLCLASGKAVLCEKPMALSASQVKAMTEASEKHSAFLMEAMWTRFLPIISLLSRIIDEGAIGEIKYVRADFGFKAHYDPASRLFNPKLGGGSLLDVGIYPLFLAMHLLGVPHSIAAKAERTSSEVDKTCLALLQYGNQASAFIHSSLAMNTKLIAEIGGMQGVIRIPAPWYRGHTVELTRNGEATKIIKEEPIVN